MREAVITTVKVATSAELLNALATANDIEVDGSLSGMPMIALRPGATLRGGTLRFGAKGVRLTSDNRLEDVTVIVPDHEVAIGNDTATADLGMLTLRNVRTRGQVFLLADHEVRRGHVEVDGLVVASADLRGRPDRPHGFGADALPGGFTLWNRHSDAAVRITATLKGIAAGTPDSPIRGSGVFVAGHGGRDRGAAGGLVDVDVLRTGLIVTDGGIQPGTPDLISGGVFVVTGARVAAVINDGPVTTRGPNDMVLDNWGEVGAWTARAPLTSHGPSGIGTITSKSWSAEKLSGFSREGAAGQALVLIIPAGHRARHVAAFHAAMDSGKLARGGAVAPVEASDKAGARLVLGLSPGLLHGLDGQVAGAVAVLRPLHGDIVEFVAPGQDN